MKKAAARKVPATKTAVKKTAVKKVVVQPAAKKAAAEVAVKKALAQKVVAKRAPAKKAVKKASVATDTVGLPAGARARTGDAVRRMVAESAVPVVLAQIAGPVRSALGPDLAPSWDGARGLKKLLQQLDLAGLTVSGGTPGYVYDPARHPKP